MAFEFPDPALGDGVDRYRVEVVQFLSTLLHSGDQIGLLQDSQVFADRLPRHVEARAEFVQRLAIIGAQPVKQFPAASIGQGFEDFIHTHNMQPFGCLSRTKFIGGACPLLAQSGHGNRAQQCPLLGVKRASHKRPRMSAFDPKRT